MGKKVGEENSKFTIVSIFTFNLSKYGSNTLDRNVQRVWKGSRKAIPCHNQNCIPNSSPSFSCVSVLLFLINSSSAGILQSSCPPIHLKSERPQSLDDIFQPQESWKKMYSIGFRCTLCRNIDTSHDKQL